MNDRSQLSNFRGNYVFGFLSCGPYERIPRWAYDMFCPTVEADPLTGEAKVAECGLRRVEASLLKGGYSREEVMVAHPEYVERAIGPETKVVGVGVMDPLGIGPVSSALKTRGSTPWNAFLFSELLKKLNRIRRAKNYKFLIVVGGAGAWQLRKFREYKEKLGIDHVIEGEVDSSAPLFFNAIENGDAPEFMRSITKSIDEVPEILGPTVNSLIEAMRGCGRGCPFCDVNKRIKRDFPIDRLVRETSVNRNYGFDYLWLHSDEMLLYGCDNKDYIPNRDAIKELYETLRYKLAFRTIGTTHFTLSSVVAEPKVIEDIARINNLGPMKWLGVQPGIETASPRIGKYWLAYKTKPYCIDEWPWVVKEGIKICNKNYIYPCCTLIVGFPDETEDDTYDTIQLVDEIARERLECILAPLLYVDYERPERSMSFNKMTRAQFELYYKCWKHNLIQFSRRLGDVIRPRAFSPLAKITTLIVGRLGIFAILKFLNGLSLELFGKKAEDLIKTPLGG